MREYEGGFKGFHPDEYVKWFLPYVSEITRILKPTGSFILNINDKVVKTFRHPFVFELIFAIHNVEDYCKAQRNEEIKHAQHEDVRAIVLQQRKFLANPHRFGDKMEYLFWFSKTDGKRKINMDAMREIRQKERCSDETTTHQAIPQGIRGRSN